MSRPPRIAPHPAVLARRETERLAIVAQRSAERTETKAFDLIIRSLLTLSPASRRKVIEEIAAMDMDLLDPSEATETPEVPTVPPPNEKQTTPAVGAPGGPVVVRDDLPPSVADLVFALETAPTYEFVKSLGEKVISIRKADKEHASMITTAYNDALARTKKAA